MQQEDKQFIVNFLSFDFEIDKLEEVFKKVSSIIDNDENIRKQNETAIKLNRNHVTKVLELFYQNKISANDISYWAWYMVQLHYFLEIVDYEPPVGDVVEEIERYNLHEINKELVIDSLKKLWPLGDHKFKKY